MLEAAKNNDWKKVARLFQGTASLQQRDMEGKNLLHWAAIHGQAEFLAHHQNLLKEKFVNAPDNNSHTALYLATRHGHWDCVKQLLLAKANLQALAPDGQLLLKYWVTSISDPALLEDLLSTQTAEARLNCLSMQADGLSLLHHAAAAGQAKVVDWLLNQGIVHEEKQEEKNGAQLRPALHVNHSDPHGYTPLYHAIKYGHAETVAVLLAHGAKLDVLNINGDSPIHHAMRNGQLALAQQLTQHLLRQLGFDQRPERQALLQAFSTLYAYHHRQTAEQFFEQAQKEHEAYRQQEELSNWSESSVKEAGEHAEKVKQEKERVELLSDEELEQLFQAHQLGQARNQLLGLLRQLDPLDPLIPVILLGLSEACLQQKDQQHAYEQAMGYAASAAMHYQKLAREVFSHSASSEAVVLYQTLLASQQNRIILTYRQLVLGLMDNPGDLDLSEYRTELYQHREELKKTLKQKVASSQTFHDLVRKNTHFFMTTTKHIWMQSLALSQERPPCAYALLSLGSMSKEEMCPYSDLEFVLVLEQDNKATRQFFQPIVRLMQLLVIAFGETPMAIPARVLFSANAAGYHFDQGGNTPLNDDFLGSPAFLADIQRRPEDILIITRNVLRTTGFIAGDVHLYQSYQQQLKQVLSEKVTVAKRFFFSSSLQRQQIQALEILTGALPEFSPSSLTDQRHSRGVDQLNIKTDLYRLPSQVIDSLSLYYGIRGNTTFEKLKWLEKEEVIAQQTALQLARLLKTILKFRMLTHLYYGTEQESVSYQANQRELRLPHEASVYVLEEEEREEILNAYQILLLLEFAVRVFVSSKGENNLFKQALVYSQAKLTKNPALRHHLEARSYERLFSPEKALNSHRQALHLDPDNPEIHLHYIGYVQSLREMHKKSQVAHEAAAVSYVKQLVTHLLVLHAKQLLTLSGFDPYYEVVPIAWRTAFKSALNANNPFHRRLAERLQRLDSLSKEDVERAHQEAKATIAAKALPLLKANEWEHLNTALKDQAHSTEEQTFLLAHTFSLLTPLIKSDTQQISDDDQEIKNSLDKITCCLLKPVKGARESAPLLAFYRRLPFAARPAFRHAILQHQEQITQSRHSFLKQQKTDQTFFSLFLKTLNEEPDEAGQRENWQQHKQEWRKTLNNLVDKEQATAANSAYLVSPLLDRAGRKIMRPLKAEVQRALLDEALEFKSSIINGSQHHVVRLKIKQSDGKSSELYCKAYPEMPGMTYLIERLHHRLIGHGTCVSELVKLERPGKAPIPVLISEGVPGPTLHEILVKKDFGQLKRLNHQSYSGLVILAILTNPEDGLPTNYIVTPHAGNPQQLTLVSVDHDHALFPPYLLEPVKAATQEESKQEDAEEAEEEKQSFKPELQIKTILFCLDAMHKPIDPDTREKLLRLKPDKILGSVLREAQVQNDYYGQLFDPEMIQAFHETRPGLLNKWLGEDKQHPENCTIPIPLKEGDAIKLYQKLHRLQQFLTEHPKATLLQCLLQIEPRVGMAYTRVLDDYRDPLERLLKLGKYPVNLQGQMVTNTSALKSLRIQTQQIGAEHYVDLKDLTPAQGLAELDLMTYQQNTLSSIRAEVMQGDLRRFLALKAPEHKSAVISGTDLRREGIDWSKLDENKQRALLDALKDIPFTHLNLWGCTVLTKQQLIGLLVQSPDCIALSLGGNLIAEDSWVDTSDLLLDDSWVVEIARNARHLKELTIRQAPNLEHIRNTAVFHHLNTLDIADNPALQTLDIKAPQLKYLQAKHCSKLSTLKTGSQQLREVDATNNASLRLTKEVGNSDSAYTLNALKLLGCTNIKDKEAFSAYPFLLWSSLSGQARVIAILLLDQYLGRTDGWRHLEEEQKNQVIEKSELLKYDEGQVLTLTLREIKSASRSVRESTQRTPVTLASSLHFSNEQFAQMLVAVVAGLKDKEWGVRQTAQQTLLDLARNPYLPDQQVAQILAAVVSCLKDKEWDVRQAAQRVLVAISQHSRLLAIANKHLGIFEQVTAQMSVVIPDLKNKNSDVRKTAQQKLAGVSQYSGLSAQQTAEILAVSLSDLKDGYLHIREIAQERLVDISQHSSLSEQQIIEIFAVVLSSMKRNEWFIRDVDERTLFVLSQHPRLPEQQLAEILNAAFSSTKDEMGFVRANAQKALIVLAANPCLSDQQVAQILIAVISGLKDKDENVQQTTQSNLIQQAKRCSSNQSPRYFTWINTFMQVADIHIQLTAVSMSFILHQRFGLEPYLLALQAERKQQTSVNIYKPTWLEGGIYGQLEVQAIDFYTPGYLQQRVEAYEELLNKQLAHDEEQLTRLQQEIHILRDQAAPIRMGAQASQVAPVENQPAISQLQLQQENLLRNCNQTRQLIEAIAAIEQVPPLKAFYRRVQMKLMECFLAASALCSEVAAPAAAESKSDIPNTISVAGVMLLIPYAALVNQLNNALSLTSPTGRGVNEDAFSVPTPFLIERGVSEQASSVSSFIEIDQLAEQIARLLAWRYETQLQKLTPESAVLLGESAVALMVIGLSQMQNQPALAANSSMAERFIQVIYQINLIYPPQLVQQTLKTALADSSWPALSVLLKPGIALWDREKLTFSFHIQEDQAQAIATEAEIYGYRLGSLQEVMSSPVVTQKKAEQTEEQKEEESTQTEEVILSLTVVNISEPETRIGLRFMEEAQQKRRSMVSTIQLRELPQRAAENQGETLEQKDEEIAAADLSSNAAVSPAVQSEVPQNHSRRPTKRVRFFDQVTIIPADIMPPAIDIPHDFICPISKEIMQDPVILLDDGFTYERAYLETYLKETVDAVSPMTGAKLVLRQWEPNDDLKKRITDFYTQFPILRDRVTPDADTCYARFVERLDDEIEQQKLRRRAPFFTYLQHVKDYLEKRRLLEQHTGPNNYDVFISYAWQDQDKRNLEPHRKLQGFLMCLHDDLQRMGLNVFLDCKDMSRNMKAVMEESVAQSGIILSSCTRFLKKAVTDKPKGNVALEVNCAVTRATKQPEALLPLLCEGEWDEALPLQMQGKVMQAHPCQNVRRVFYKFDRHQLFSSAYMDWMVDHLIPRVLNNLGVLSDDVWLASLAQCYHSEQARAQLPEQLTPHEQFEHNYPGSSPEARTAIGLQAFEFSLSRLAELTQYHHARSQASDSKDELPEQAVLLVVPSSADPAFTAWIVQFTRHLELAGIQVTCWTGQGDLPQQLPRSVIALCTPDLKETVEVGLDQQKSRWSQLQQHLAQSDVICYPVIYQGRHRTAVPDWSKNYPGHWQKNFLARNTEGASLDISQPHYYELMMGINPKGLLRDLLRYEDNDRCYNFLYDHLQMMLKGWSTKALLNLEMFGQAAETQFSSALQASAKEESKDETMPAHTGQLATQPTVQTQPARSPLASAMKKLGVFTVTQSGTRDQKSDASHNATTAAVTSAYLHQKLMDALEKWDTEEAIRRSLNEEELRLSVKRMQARAKHFGYRCIDVKRDGRCFYHAFILQLKRINPAFYQDLTVQICLERITQHIIENQALYEQFIYQVNGMSLDNFLDMVLKNDGTLWADNILISAAARTFNVDLVIVHNDGNRPFVSRRRRAEGLIYLGHEVEQHYQALEQDPTVVPQEMLDAYRIGAAIDEIEKQGGKSLGMM